MGAKRPWRAVQRPLTPRPNTGTNTPKASGVNVLNPAVVMATMTWMARRPASRRFTGAGTAGPARRYSPATEISSVRLRWMAWA